MNFTDLLAARESCRNFASTPVSREDLLKILEAGRLSPSACNSQPWKFILVDDPAAREKMCDALTLDNGDSGAPWADKVPAFIILVEEKAEVKPAVENHYKDTQHFAASDIGMACMSMCYQASDLGLSTCVLGLNEQYKMEKHFAIPAGHTVRMVLAVGYSATGSAPRKKTRKSLEEVCSFNRWE